MIRFALSTLSCVDRTFEEAFSLGRELGCAGLELRTFGNEGTRLACEPTQTDPRKVTALAEAAGLAVAGLATSITFDRPVRPPVVGWIFEDADRWTRSVRSLVNTARELAAPTVRVFAFSIPPWASRERYTSLIADRLALAATVCRNTGVRLALENGGSFSTATDIADLLDRVSSPHLGASYCPAAARAAGESPVSGLNVLGERTLCVRLKDFRRGVPCALGEGDEPVREVVDALGTSDFAGWMVYEPDHAWLPGAQGRVLDDVRRSCENVYAWLEGAAVTALRA